MQPGRRYVVGHVRPADAQVESLAVGQVVIQAHKETISRASNGDGVDAIVAVAVRSRSGIRLRVECHVVSKDCALQREQLVPSWTRATGDIGLRANFAT